MKPVFLLTILSSLGFTFSMSIMPTLAGSVPVGAASGVTLPTSLDTSNISPPIIPPPEIATPTAETPPTQTTPAAPIISPDTQVILNQTASQTLGEIQVTAPVVADTVISTTPVVVSSPVNEITITTNSNSTVPSTPITVVTPAVPSTPITVVTPAVPSTPTTVATPPTSSTPITVVTPAVPSTPTTVVTPAVPSTPTTVATPPTSSTPATVVTPAVPSTPTTVATPPTSSTPATVATSPTPSSPATVVTPPTPSNPATVVTSPTSSTPATVVTSTNNNNSATTSTNNNNSATSSTPATVVTSTNNNNSATTSVIPSIPVTAVTIPTSINNSAIVATPLQAGRSVADQISLGQGVEVTSNTTAVRILPISPTADSQTLSTTATVTTANRQTLNLVLKGTSNQIANAAGFIATATSAELSISQIQTGTSIALTGANFTQVADLINSLSGLMVIGTNQTLEPKLEKGQLLSSLASNIVNSSTLPSDPKNKSESNSKLVQSVTIEPVRLNRAILIFNQIIDTSDDATVTALSRNVEFTTIGQVLKRLSKAFDKEN